MEMAHLIHGFKLNGMLQSQMKNGKIAQESMTKKQHTHTRMNPMNMQTTN